MRVGQRSAELPWYSQAPVRRSAEAHVKLIVHIPSQIGRGHEKKSEKTQGDKDTLQQPTNDQGLSCDPKKGRAGRTP